MPCEAQGTCSDVFLAWGPRMGQAGVWWSSSGGWAATKDVPACAGCIPTRTLGGPELVDTCAAFVWGRRVF
eukprot:7962088-Lingulodinium_polyedra.AAC.1